MHWHVLQGSHENVKGSWHTEKAYWPPAATGGQLSVIQGLSDYIRTLWPWLSFTEKNLIKKWESMQQSQERPERKKKKKKKDKYNCLNSNSWQIRGSRGKKSTDPKRYKILKEKEKRESEDTNSKTVRISWFQGTRGASICTGWLRLGRCLIRIMSLPL